MTLGDVLTLRVVRKTWLRSFLVGFELFSIVSGIGKLLWLFTHSDFVHKYDHQLAVGFVILVGLWVVWLFGWMIVDYHRLMHERDR